MILIIDNYDSFAYNLAQYIGELGREPCVFRNDAVTLQEIERMNPSHIVISPGPCTPLEAGISNNVMSHFCLGHQCIGYVYGAKVVHAPIPTHGKSSLVYHDTRTVYKGLPNPFEGGRYHSLVVNWERRPPQLEATATTADGVIMGIRHKHYNVEGLQFHPESIMTDVGHQVLQNFLSCNSAVWL
jgi:anthranilate synthase/aminodeoxychorismate synthase-like glutamine amidotransferase